MDRCCLRTDLEWPDREGELAAWRGPDVLILSFQEINALNAVNVVAGGDERGAEAWRAAVHCALNETPLPDGVAAAQVRRMWRRDRGADMHSCFLG